jgi:hypothetical protein
LAVDELPDKSFKDAAFGCRDALRGTHSGSSLALLSIKPKAAPVLKACAA